MNRISPSFGRALFLLLLALTVAPDGIGQTFESRIFFSSNRDGDWNIYSMDANGDNLVQLTNHPASDEYPACSADGRRIVFASDRGVTSDLYVMDSNGNNIIRLTQDNFFAGLASWSPDGTKIAFSSFCKINCDIFTVDPSGDNLTRLVKHKMYDVRPSWSPDGSKIALVGARDGGAFTPFHIFVVNADGKERRNLTEDTNLTDNFSPIWSPDGRKIAFDSRRHFREGTRDGIFTITVDGKELEQLTDGPGSSRSPVYSPDGTEIAYVSHRGGDYNIYLMDGNGKNSVKLTRTPLGTDNVNPSWPRGALAVHPNGKLPISWGELKRRGNP